MEKDPEENNKKNQYKAKVVKDFGFLLKLQAKPANQKVTKYVIKEGESHYIIREDDEFFDVVYSYTKYDYEGKTILNVNCAKMSNQETKDLLMRDLLLGMKVKQRAWFNICDYPVYRRKGGSQNKNGHLTFQNTQDQDLLFQQDIPTIIEEQEIKSQQQQNKIETQIDSIAKTSQQKLNEEEFELIDSEPEMRNGIHYQIFVQRLEYKNSENFESKMKVFDQKKEDARKFFSDKKYQEASRNFVYLDSITSNPRKFKKDPQTGNYTNQAFYTNEQLLQLQNKNVNAKINYLRCFFKMVESVSTQQKQQAKRFLDSLLQKQDQNSVTHFLHAKWLLNERCLDAALDAAKRSRQLQKHKATEDLIALIQVERANKHKIKVKVQQNP